MTSRPPAQCTYCRRWTPPPVGANDSENGTGQTCEAYPGGIPGDIWANRLDHRLPQPGDHGLTWLSDSVDTTFPAWVLDLGHGGRVAGGSVDALTDWPNFGNANDAE